MKWGDENIWFLFFAVLGFVAAAAVVVGGVGDVVDRVAVEGGGGGGGASITSAPATGSVAVTGSFLSAALPVVVGEEG